MQTRIYGLGIEWGLHNLGSRMTNLKFWFGELLYRVKENELEFRVKVGKKLQLKVKEGELKFRANKTKFFRVNDSELEKRVRGSKLEFNNLGYNYSYTTQGRRARLYGWEERIWWLC